MAVRRDDGRPGVSRRPSMSKRDRPVRSLQEMATLKIVIHSLYAAPEKIGIAFYTSDMARGLAARGHSVTVITSKPYYPQWAVHEGYRGARYLRRTGPDGVKSVFCPLYVPARPSGAKRIVHYFTFALSSLIPLVSTARRERADVIIAVVPALFGAPGARFAARLCGAKSWLHVQDLEVDAAAGTGLIARDGLALRVARWVERRILRGFDRVSSLCAPMLERLAQKGVARDRLYELRNWADLSQVAPLEGPSPLRAEFGIQTPHVALYSGNIGNKQGIGILAEAARLLAGRDDLTFVICGDGPALPGLKAAAAGLGNVRFHPLQERARLGALMGLADVHLLPQLGDAADLLLPSKLTNMLASGRPVLATALPGTALAEEVAGCGVCVPPEDARAFAAALAEMLDAPERRAEMGRAARARALSHWDGDAVLSRLEHELCVLTRTPAPVRPIPVADAEGQET